MLHNFTLTRRQAGMFKICLISIGIVLGIYFGKHLKKVERLRRVLALAIGIYLGITYLSQ